MRIITTFIFLLLFSLVLVVSCGKKQSTDSKEISEKQNDEKFEKTDTKKDAEFAVKAADGGMLEVKLGQLAQSNATNADVKKFGQHMIDDHSKANSELQSLAQQKDISIPGTLSDDNQKKYDELAKKTGSDFDKAYCEFMVRDHKEDIDAFQREADKGEDAELKSWAAEKLPTLKHHLQMAEDAEKTVKKAS